MEAQMADIKDLREKMAKIATEARAKLSEVTDSTPDDRAAEIEREFDAMMADHDKLAAKVERLGKVEAALRAGDDVDLDRRPAFENRSAPAVDEGFKMDYRTAFAEMIAAGGEGYVDGANVRRRTVHRHQLC
jgi:HK97 family phage major capsid protein